MRAKAKYGDLMQQHHPAKCLRKWDSYLCKHQQQRYEAASYLSANVAPICPSFQQPSAYAHFSLRFTSEICCSCKIMDNKVAWCRWKIAYCNWSTHKPSSKVLYLERTNLHIQSQRLVLIIQQPSATADISQSEICCFLTAAISARVKIPKNPSKKLNALISQIANFLYGQLNKTRSRAKGSQQW